MRFTGKVHLALLSALLCGAGALRADTINVFMNSTGAVPSVDRTATFNSLTTGTDISNYSEGGLTFSLPGSQDYINFTPAPAGFSGGFFYRGASNPMTISTSDGATLYGIQFYIGSGYAQDNVGSQLPIAYALFRGATQVGSGNFVATQTAAGFLLGFSDASGFTSMQISNCSVAPCSLSGSQALAIDNVSADVTAISAPVPEPGALTLLGTIIAGMFAATRSLRQRSARREFIG